MELTIRDWTREDVSDIGALWLDALGESDLAGMTLRRDVAARLRSWLLQRYRDRGSIGRVAEADSAFAGFVLGRVGEWESLPPIVRPQKLGVIDVVCVRTDVRNQGIGGRLVSDALDRMALRGAERIETAQEIANPAASRLWARMGFRPSLQRLWKPVDPTSGP